MIKHYLVKKEWRTLTGKDMRRDAPIVDMLTETKKQEMQRRKHDSYRLMLAAVLLRGYSRIQMSRKLPFQASLEFQS